MFAQTLEHEGIFMTPSKGQHVKCILRNGAIAEGIVEEWFNNHVQLKSLDGESILIITHPSEDIMLIKVSLEQEKSEAERVADKIRAHSSQRAENELDEYFEQAVEAHDPTNPDDRKSLAELRIELAKEERKIIAEKLKDHRPSPYKPGTTPYHYPPVIMKQKSAYQPARIPNGQSRPSKK